MPRTGRPKLLINRDLFEDLCRIQCTMPEITGVLRVSEETLRRWVKRTYGNFTFETIRAQKAEGGKASLRRAQINLALDSENPTMLIWLGKQYLGQRDKQELDLKFTEDESAKQAFAHFRSQHPDLSEEECRELLSSGPNPIPVELMSDKVQ